MMMKPPGRGAMISNIETMQDQYEAPWRVQSRLVSGKLLQESLTMFLDLGLTACEMSRLSGFPTAVIAEGLKQFDETHGKK